MSAMRASLWVTIAFLAASVMVPSARADIVVYSDMAAWNAVTTGATTIGFEGIAPAGGFAYYMTPQGLTIDGVQFLGPGTGSVSNYLVVGDSAAYPWYSWGTGAVLHGLTGPDGEYPGVITAILPGGYTSISANVMSFLPYGNNVIVTFSDGSSISVAVPYNGTGDQLPGWFGMTSTIDITSVTFQASGASYLNIDNFTFGQDPPLPGTLSASAVPEPASLVLFGSGLIGLAGLIRRKRS